MNEVLKNIETRRSTRSFTDEIIPKEILINILHAGVYAPSGMNKQSWQFTVTQNTQNIQNLSNKIAHILGRGPEYDMYQPNTIILVSNDRGNSNGLADCACALENMFLAAHSLGIGSCWINQLKTICDEQEIRELLTEFEIPKTHIVWGIAALGYPKEQGKEKGRNMGVIRFIDE